MINKPAANPPLQWIPYIRSTHIFPGFEGLDLVFIFVFEFLIFWPVVVQIWLWDTSQWLQNDQLYRIATRAIYMAL